LLIAAFYDPIWTVGVTDAADFALASAAFLLLFVWKVPPWAVVILCAIGGGLIAAA
jgi:chromate transporter